MALDEFDRRSTGFLTWFKNLPGTTFHDDIEIRDLRARNAGRGIIAKNDIPANTVLFTVPRKEIICLANSELAQKLPGVFANIGGVSLDDDDENDDDADGSSSDGSDRIQDSWTSLILVMIYEHLRGAASPWRPYLEILPTSFDTPMFWSEDELKQLQASPVVSSIGHAEADEMIRTKILSAIREHRAVFFPEGAAGLSDEQLMQLAHRMGSTIMAYAFDLENDDEGENGSTGEDEDGWVEDRDGRIMMGMVPMADVLNADAEFNAHINHSEEALVATALREIKAGEEILNYYGPLPNGQLCRRYGYTTPKHSRYDLAEVDWTSVLDGVLFHVGLGREEWDSILARYKTKGRWSEDDEALEENESFDIERENGDPDDSGHLPPPPDPTSKPVISPALLGRLKRVAKILKKEAGLADTPAWRDWIRYRAILDGIDAKLREYGTSVENDLTILNGIDDKSSADSSSGPGGSHSAARLRMALEVRTGEKKLLDEARLWASQQVEALHPEVEAEIQQISGTLKKLAAAPEEVGARQGRGGTKKKVADMDGDVDMLGDEDGYRDKEARSAKKQRRA